MSKDLSFSRQEDLGARLLAACSQGDEPLARSLVEQGANAQHYDAATNSDPLSASARRGSLPLVRWLLDITDVEPGGSSLNSALTASVAAGRSACAERLILAGAELEAEALHEAFAKGKTKAVLRLIQTGRLRSESERAASSEFWELGASLLEQAFSYSALQGAKDVFHACLLAGVSLTSPSAQEAGLCVAQAQWADMASLMLVLGFRPNGSVEPVWRERLASVCLAFEHKQELDRQLPAPHPKTTGHRVFTRLKSRSL